MSARSQWTRRRPGGGSGRVEEEHATIRASRRLLWTVIGGARQPIAVKDTRGRYLLANRRWDELFGWSTDDIVGKTDHDVFVEGDANVVRAADLEAMRVGTGIEFEHAPEDGEAVRITTYPLYDELAELCGTCCIAAGGLEEQEEALRGGERRVLELIACGAPLVDVLTEVTLLIEAQSEGMLCSVLLLDDEGEHVRHAAAPSLPPAYCEAIDGAPIGPKAGSWGTAAHRREAVIVGDVLEDPLWEDYRDLAAHFGLRACWSTPIFATDGKVLGTFGMYYREPRIPTQAELRLVRVATSLACIAIERDRADDALRRTEDQLRQAQKMEAVGRLAGGIAHDFNNLLTAIGGYSEFVLDGLPEDTRLRADALEIRKAAERAGTLTRQLLAFSRRSTLKLESLDPNEVVADMDKLLRRLIGADVELVTLREPDCGRFEGDRSQLEQAIVNLALNARDAMPDGGTLVIATSGADVTETADGDGEALPPGRYVLISVRDSGIGMDEETRSRIFEPFFTTKGVGSGTGLGLATVYAVVEQTGGRIFVESEPAKGTTFELYLPQTALPPAKPGDRGAEPAALQGSETILLVDDEESLRSMAARSLSDHGYRVVEAHYGSEALEVWSRHRDEIDLVVTDIVMPGISGLEVADRLAAERPEMPIVLMSGFAGVDDVPAVGVAFIEKPFTPATLLRAVREALDRTVVA